MTLSFRLINSLDLLTASKDLPHYLRDYNNRLTSLMVNRLYYIVLLVIVLNDPTLKSTTGSLCYNLAVVPGKGFSLYRVLWSRSRNHASEICVKRRRTNWLFIRDTIVFQTNYFGFQENGKAITIDSLSELRLNLKFISLKDISYALSQNMKRVRLECIVECFSGRTCETKYGLSAS